MVAVALLLRFHQGTIGVFETLGGEYASDLVGLSSASTGCTFSALGLCGAATLACFSRLLKRHRHDEVTLFLLGVYLMGASCVGMCLIPLVATQQTGGRVPSSPAVTGVFVLTVFCMYSVGECKCEHSLGPLHALTPPSLL